MAIALYVDYPIVMENVMSLIKIAILCGPKTNLQNAWLKSKGLGPKSNIPLAEGIDSSIPKSDNAG